ncbi:MAG: hypothetical protein FWE97_02760 [Dehalococcoidia bacterium]|nr:hypothetical protein [Dehalococcoidia bacterium]
MARNIHQRRTKSHKGGAAIRPAAGAAPEPVVAHMLEHVAAPSPTVAVVAGKGGISQEVMDARVAELPWELKRIAWFSAGVVILLIVLWFTLR